MRLLIVEDDKNIATSLAKVLKEHSYSVDIAYDGDKGYFMASTNPYDLIIMDFNLPLMNGREIIEKLRSEDNSTPILMLTVRDLASEKTELLNLGADDYLSKPFAVSELIARIKAIMRRPAQRLQTILSCGELSVTPDLFLVSFGKKRIYLSSKEFSLLEFMMLNKGRIVSRQEIMEHVWDENANPFSNTIEVHIKNLRKKLGGAKKMIYTFPTRGYKLDLKR